MSDNTFENLGLSETLLRAVSEAGYTTPTEIQAKAIPWILQARDVIGIARTGTGKTASFTLPMIEILADGVSKARMPRSLILSPTRELAAQIAENFDKYGKYSSLTKCLIVGGVGMDAQIQLLARGVDVLIATPGRLLDLFERGNVLLNDIKILVIDEADRMLDMGFIPDIERILKLIPPIRQTMLFSATMPGPVQKLAETFLSNARTVAVAAQSSTAETVAQNLIMVGSNRDKDRTLLKLIRDASLGVVNAFVFCNRKKDVSTVARFLTQSGVSAAPLHGDMPQANRTQTLQEFKDGKVSIMVCSDVAARGLDVSAVSHVFNYDVPFNAEDYVHRIGRTGRAGLNGAAFTLATSDDDKNIAAIEKMIGKPIPRVDAPAIERRPDDGRGTNERGGGERPARSRQPRGERSSRSAEPRPERNIEAGPEASPEATPQTNREPAAGRTPRPAQAERAKRPEREPRQHHGERRPGPANEARADGEPADSGPGFGDHLPAFMGGGKR